MSDREMKKNDNTGVEESPDTIMEETLKGIFDEVNGASEDESTDEEKKSEKAKKKMKSERDETELLSVDEGEDLVETDDEFPVLDAGEAEELEPELSALDAGEAEELEPELSADEGEDFDDDIFDEDEKPLTEEEKAKRRRKRRKVLKIVFGSIAGAIAAVYLGFAVFFMSHFYFNTKINGVDFALKSVAVVEEYMEEQVQGYTLTMKESDGGSEVISGSDISLKYEKSDELKSLLKNQNAFLWPVSLWKKPEITASVGVSYDKERLSSLIAGLDCMKEENQVVPVSAKPEFDGNEFVVKKEEVGSQVDKEVFEQKVNEYIAGFGDTLDMTEESCYLKPKYTSESPEVEAACTEMNKYLAASVTYTFGLSTEVVDKTLISQWVTTDENLKVIFNEDKVSEYIQTLASKYNTYQKQRTFTSGSGNTVKVEGGDYGWIIDKDAEYKALVESIKSGEVTTREPEYSQKAASHDGVDWGNTYVEVDLTNQYCYLFVNGSIVTSGPVVTGKPSAGDATPQGVYLIKYCQKNAVLRGPKKANGEYEWESPVTFWMPFNGGIGLHDAPWQAAYGGNRYLTHGSHGCVNLQYNVASTIYNNVKAGTPVVCHY